MDTEAMRRKLEQEQERLQAMRDRLVEQHQADSESGPQAELSSYDQHPGDAGTDTLEQEMDLSIIERVEAELQDIAQALGRIESGTYGRCQACGREIDAARLEAVPAARFCIDDQARAEGEIRSPGTRA